MTFQLKPLASFNFIKPLEDRTFTAMILALIAIIITYSGALARLDNLHYDLSHYFTAKAAPNDIVIIAIDETSLAKLGRWPWSRMVHAELVNQLKNERAKVIGLDLILSEPESTNAKADMALAQAISQAGNVVLPDMLEAGYSSKPNLLLENAAATGRVRVPLDLDGLARSIYLWEGYVGGALPDKYHPHFSQAILQVAGQLPKDEILQPPQQKTQATDFYLTPQMFVSLHPRKIKFLGAPRHFKHLAYSDVLDKNYPLHFFKDKIVLVGATAAGLGDTLPTPVSALSEPMSGVEFHANAVTTMRNDALIQDAPLWLSSLCCMLLAIAPLMFLPKLSPLKSLLFILAYYCLVTLLAIAMPRWFNIWLPPAGALIAILLAYPIWSWRKLESAQVHLDKSLRNLQAELALLGLKSEPETADDRLADSHDDMQFRISKVEMTSQYLRDVQQKRIDTLAFISHDIRTPLATAMMQLEEMQNAPLDFNQANLVRVQLMLGRALNMADAFLQSSRAEMADASKFQDIEINEVIQQAVDDVYQMAKPKGVRVETYTPNADLWVRGDFGLLQRAFANLLSNAVKYSHENSNVQVELSRIGQKMQLKVRDTGNGIPIEKINRLFKRFSRIEGEHQLPVGTGLGLYFVNICMQKHGGSIAVESKLGQGTQFTIELPLLPIENT